MSESKMLYDQLPMVADLNRVDGFDPKEYLRAYGDEKTGEAQWYFDSSPFGPKYVEMAETAAVGRALADAGFGVQFCDVTEPDDPAYDAG